MRLEIFLKSGQSFEIDCETWETSSLQFKWVSKVNKNKLLYVDKDDVAAIVRRSEN